MKKIIAVYHLVLGISIIALWIMLYTTNSITELVTEPFAITFHIVIEIIMAIMLLATGVLYLKNATYQKEFHYISYGMLLYSTINSSGYYAERNEISMIVLFGVIVITSTYFIFYRIKSID